MPYDKDVRMLVELGLKTNAKVRAVVEGYVQLTEAEKAAFRLAVGVSQDTADNGTKSRRRTSDRRSSAIGQDRVQPLVQSLMRTLLEEHPTLLDDADIRKLLDRDYCQNALGLQLGGFPLLRRLEVGRKGSGSDRRDRYYTNPYASKFYVCNHWWKAHHLANAQSLILFVTQLVERDPGHPGVRTLERHKQAFQDYVGQALSSNS